MHTNNITARAFTRSPGSEWTESTKKEERSFKKDIEVSKPGTSSEACRSVVTTNWKQCQFSNSRQQPLHERDEEFKDCVDFPAVEVDDLIDLYLQFGTDHSRTALLTDSWTSLSDRDFQLCEAESCSSSESFYSVISNDYYPWLMVKQVGVATSFPGDGCLRLVANDDCDLSAITAADLLELSILMDLESLNDKEPEEKVVEIVKRQYEENSNFNLKRKGVSIYDVNKSSKCGPSGFKSSVSYYTENSLAHNVTNLSTSDQQRRNKNEKFKIEESISKNKIELSSPNQSITYKATTKDISETHLQEEKHISEAITSFTRSLKKFNRGTVQKKSDQVADHQNRVSTEQHLRTGRKKYTSNVIKAGEETIASLENKQLSPRKSQSECDWKVFCHKWTLDHIDEENVSAKILVRESKEEISESHGNLQISSVLSSNDDVSKVGFTTKEVSTNIMSQSDNGNTLTARRKISTCMNAPVIQESTKANSDRTSDYVSVTRKSMEKQSEEKTFNTCNSAGNKQRALYNPKVTLCEDNPNDILQEETCMSTRSIVNETSGHSFSFQPPPIPKKTGKRVQIYKEEISGRRKNPPNSYEKHIASNRSVVSNVEYQIANPNKNQINENDKNSAPVSVVSRFEKSREVSSGLKNPGSVHSKSVSESITVKENVDTDQACSKGKEKYDTMGPMFRDVNVSSLRENKEKVVKSTVTEKAPQKGVSISSNEKQFSCEIMSRDDKIFSRCEDTYTSKDVVTPIKESTEVSTDNVGTSMMLKQTTRNEMCPDTTVSTLTKTRKFSEGKDAGSNVFHQEETINQHVTYDGSAGESTTQKSSYLSAEGNDKGAVINFDEVTTTSSQPPMMRKSVNPVKIVREDTSENRMYQNISEKQNTSTTSKGGHRITRSEKEKNVTTTNMVSVNDDGLLSNSEQKHTVLDMVQSCSEAKSIKTNEQVGGLHVRSIGESINEILDTEYEDVNVEIFDEADKHVVKLEFVKEYADNLSIDETPSTSAIELKEEVILSRRDDAERKFEHSYKSINNKNIGFDYSKSVDKTANTILAPNGATVSTFATSQKTLSTQGMQENSFKFDKSTIKVEPPMEYKKAIHTEKKVRSSVRDAIANIETRCKAERDSKTVAVNKHVAYSTGKDEPCYMFKNVSIQVEPMHAKNRENNIVVETSSNSVRKSANLSAKNSGNANATFMDDQKTALTKNYMQVGTYSRSSETSSSSPTRGFEISISKRKDIGTNCNLDCEFRVENKYESAINKKKTQSNISQNIVSTSTRISPTDFATDLTISTTKRNVSSSQEHGSTKSKNRTQSGISQNMVSTSTRISPTEFTTDMTISTAKNNVFSSQGNESVSNKKTTQSNISQSMVSNSTRISPTEFATNSTISTAKNKVFSSQGNELVKNKNTTHADISQNMVSTSTRISPTEFATNSTISTVKQNVFSSQENEGNVPNLKEGLRSKTTKTTKNNKMSVRDAVATIESRCQSDNVPGTLFATESASYSADKDESYIMFQNASIPVEPIHSGAVRNDSITSRSVVTGNHASHESTQWSVVSPPGTPEGNFQNLDYQINTENRFGINNCVASNAENGILNSESNLSNKEERYMVRTKRVSYNKNGRNGNTDRIPSENPSRCSTVSIESEDNEMMTIGYRNTSYTNPKMKCDNESISFSRDKDEAYMMYQNESIEEEPNFTVGRVNGVPNKQNRLVTTEKESNNFKFNSMTDRGIPKSAFVSMKDLGSDTSASSDNEIRRRSPSPIIRTSENQSYQKNSKTHGVKYEITKSRQEIPFSLSSRQSKDHKIICREENVNRRCDVDTSNGTIEQRYGSIKSEKKAHVQTSNSSGQNKMPLSSCITTLRNSTSGKFMPSSQYEGESSEEVYSFNISKGKGKRGLKMETSETKGLKSTKKQTVTSNQYKPNEQISYSSDKEETHILFRNATLGEEPEMYPQKRNPANDSHSISPGVYLEEKSDNLVVTFFGGISESIIPKSAFLTPKSNSNSASISLERAGTSADPSTPMKHSSCKKKTHFDHIIYREKKFVCKRCKNGEKVRLIEKTEQGSRGLDFDFNIPKVKKQNVIDGKNLLHTVAHLLNKTCKPSLQQVTERTQISHNDGHDLTHSRTKIRCSLCKQSQ